MSALFVSYRRDDTSGHAGRLYDRLADRFGSEQIFRDVDEISYGDDFVDTIDQAVGSCKALIAIIGPAWLSIQDRHGRRRRLDNPNDFVRIELESALARGIPIFPILVRGAEMPDAAGLPDSISRLARRQALEISETRFEYDIGQLLEVLEAKVGLTQRLNPAETGGQDRDAAGSHAGSSRGPDVSAVTGGENVTKDYGRASIKPNRKAGALQGILIASVYAIVCEIVVFHDDRRLQVITGDMIGALALYVVISAAVGAVCGAIVGKSPGVLVPIAAAITVVTAVWVAVWGTYQDVVITGLIMGGGVAAMLVSMIWRLIQRRKPERPSVQPE